MPRGGLSGAAESGKAAFNQRTRLRLRSLSRLLWAPSRLQGARCWPAAGAGPSGWGRRSCAAAIPSFAIRPPPAKPHPAARDQKPAAGQPASLQAHRAAPATLGALAADKSWPASCDQLTATGQREQTMPPVSCQCHNLTSSPSKRGRRLFGRSKMSYSRLPANRAGLSLCKFDCARR